MADDTEPRYRAVHAYLSDDAHQTWQEVTTELGVSISGLVEAMGSDLGRAPDDRALEPRLDTLVRQARRVDAERRRRTHH